MQQVSALWGALDPRKRLIAAGAALSVFVAILWLAGTSSRSDLALLYAGLEGARAGEIVTALEQRGAAYEVRGDSIYVESTRRDELRMTLAAEGLPAAGGMGYELLDSLTGFGTTSQMFDAAYWRAKEGELARTIVSSPGIRSARVHIATPSGQPFRKDLRPTASVTVVTAAGSLAAPRAKALKFLVASAVSGMSPEDVSIIDGNGALIGTGEEAGPANDRAVEIRNNVERLLEARVGYGNAVVEVSLETVSEREAITERRFDPEGRVAISVDTEERSDMSDEMRPGAVSVASNLPEGDAANGGKSQSNVTETRERTNFEVSETTREVLRTPGGIKRLTVAVLVDGLQVADGAGNISWQARPEEELSALRELVASAVGFDEARGDVITLRSMPFEQAAAQGEIAHAGMFAPSDINLMQLIQTVILSAVALVLGLFVLRPLLMRPPARDLPRLGRGGDLGGAALREGAIDMEDVAQPPVTLTDELRRTDRQLPVTFDATAAASGQTHDPVLRLKRLIEERQSESVEILRSWMEDEGETA